MSNEWNKILEQEKLIDELVDFITFVIKCVKRNGEYSPASSQELREIEVAINGYYEYQVDNKGNCPNCKQGTMKEMSIYDDMDGMLTCDKCGVRVSS